jgi:hypothetical protein
MFPGQLRLAYVCLRQMVPDLRRFERRFFSESVVSTGRKWFSVRACE